MRLLELFENETVQPTPLMIVVHPGSACGSANFNLGKYEGRAARDGLVHEISNWSGSVLVVDGELSDELPDYPELDSAIKQAIAKANAAKLGAGRIYACAMNTPNWPPLVAKAAKILKATPDTPIKITGAWYSPGPMGGDGCVNAAWNALWDAGFRKLDVMDSAVEELDDEDDEDEEYEDEEYGDEEY